MRGGNTGVCEASTFVSARAARLVRTQGGITILCREVKFQDSCMVRVPDELGPPNSYRSASRIFVHCICVLNCALHLCVELCIASVCELNVVIVTHMILLSHIMLLYISCCSLYRVAMYVMLYWHVCILSYMLFLDCDPLLLL